MGQAAIFLTELSAGIVRSLGDAATSLAVYARTSSAPRVKEGEVPISILRDITLLSGWASLQEQKHKRLSLGVGLFEQAVEDKLSFF